MNRRRLLVLVPTAVLFVLGCNLNPATTAPRIDLSEVSLSGQRDVLYWGDSMTVSAAPSQGMSFLWRIDGSSVSGATSASVTVGSTLSKGAHQIDLIVTKEGVSKTIGCNFSVEQVPLSELVSEVSETEIMRTTADLVNFGTRFVGTEGNIAAATYLHDRLSDLPNVVVAYHSTQFRNVIGTLPSGNPDSDIVYMVGAHYDSTSNTPGIAPGATDNASGVAIVLEFARVMSRYTFEHPVVFGFWNDEEGTGGGSKEYADEAYSNSVKIGLYLNLDSSSYDPNNSFVLDIMHDPNSKWASDLMTANNSLYDFGLSLTYNVHNCSSDYVHFRDHGYAWLMTHEPTHGPAHTADDTLDKISAAYAARNGRLCLSVLAELAGGN